MGYQNIYAQNIIIFDSYINTIFENCFKKPNVYINGLKNKA